LTSGVTSALDASLQIFRGNETMMNQADAIVANLTPFRRPGADAGMVWHDLTSFEACVRLAALRLAAANRCALG
jgi:nucleoside 2-deoxyribosyltransferase